MKVKNKFAKLLAVFMSVTVLVSAVGLSAALNAGAAPVAPANPPARAGENALTVSPTLEPGSIWPGAPPGVATGYPAFYADATGTQVTLLSPKPPGLVGNGLGVTPPTQIFLAPNPLNPYSVFLGFDAEAFYYMARNRAAIAVGGRAFTMTIGLEAGFATGVAIPGDEMVFERILVKIGGLAPGQEGVYTIKEPYGTHTVTITAADTAKGVFTFKQDIGLTPRIFTAALAGPISVFLKPTIPAPPGWLGDGVSIGTVTGSPTGFNALQITGPLGFNILSDQWQIAGRLFPLVAPAASFTMTPALATGAAPLTANFTSTSTGPASSWLWDFGDGTPAAPSTSTIPNPTHIYTVPGTYTVSLTVNNAVGPASTITKVVTVTPGVPAIPVASFLMSTTTGSAPLTVNFTDTSTGVPSSFTWNFGDGTPALTGLAAVAANPSHTFLTAGTFTVTELATNNLGSGAVSKIITVTPPVPAVPVAAFITTPAVGVPPLAVKFTDATSGVPTSWSWNFGDGSALSTLQNPTHTYSTAGIFAVTETVTNALGTSVATNVVTVATPPAAPTGLTATVVSSTQVNLVWTDNATNETLYMIQRAPDATFTAGMVEQHALANAVTFSDITATASTTYQYRVIAGGTVGNSAPSNVVTVTTPATGGVVPPPVLAASFTMAPASGVMPLAVTFTDASTGPPTAWSWNFGDTGTSVIQSPIHTFATAGTFTVTETVTNTTLTPSTATITHTVTVTATAPAVVPPPVVAPPPPVFSGGGGGGGGFTPLPPPPPAPVINAVSLSGLVSSTGLNEDNTGKIQNDAQIKTANDDVVLTLPAGTIMSDKNGGKIISISAAVAANPSPAASGASIISVYNLGPDGALFDPPIGITMKFDKTKVPAEVSADKLYIATWDGTAWVKLASVVNAASSTITATTPHFSQFAIIAEGAAPAKAPAEAIQPAPTAPAGLKGGLTTDGMVSLSWDSNPDSNNIGFMVERSNDNKFAVGAVDFHTIDNSVTFTDITVAPGKTYFYRVLGVTGVGHSDPSNVVSVTTPAAAVTPPVTTSPPPTTTKAPAPVATTAAPPPVTEPESSGSATGWIIGGIVALALVTVLAMVMRRKKV